MSSTHCLHNHVHSPSAGSVLVNNIIGFDDYARLPSFPGEYTDTPPPERDKYQSLTAPPHHVIPSSPSLEHSVISHAIDLNTLHPYCSWFLWLILRAITVKNFSAICYVFSLILLQWGFMKAHSILCAAEHFQRFISTPRPPPDPDSSRPLPDCEHGLAHLIFVPQWCVDTLWWWTQHFAQFLLDHWFSAVSALTSQPWCLFVSPFVHSVVHSSVCQFIHSSVRPFFSSVSPFVRSSVRSVVRSSVRPFSSSVWSVRPFLSVRPSVCPCIRSSVRWFVHSSVLHIHSSVLHIFIG